MSGSLAIASTTAAVSGSSWNVASQLSVTMPATGGTAFQVSGTSTLLIDSVLIAVASGGVFSAQPASSSAATVAMRTNRRLVIGTLSVTQADRVLDDHVVEIRLDANQHLPDQVNQWEVLG